MKILSFQPQSLYENGGAARLLRRLYAGRETQVTSLFVNYSFTPIKIGKVKEIFISVFPKHRSWMRWKLRSFFSWLRDKLFFSLTKKKLLRTAFKIPFDVLHIVNHSVYSSAICDEALLDKKKLWVSFHDHFSTTHSSFEDTMYLWNRADRRLLISKALGEEYQRLFGENTFELITDGVSEQEISQPKKLNSNNIIIYFSGLLHLEYYPLFDTLAEALDKLSTENKSFTLILRGVEKLPLLNNRKFKVEYRTDFISDAEIKKEQDQADILYLPIKFSHPEFYLYSLSTKMIGYLGSSGRILYHGPDDSAAYIALKNNEASSNCLSLNIGDMLNSIEKLLEPDNKVSFNAKKMAQNYFVLNDIQKSFWNETN
ncbi:hypothetical protein [Algibacter aquimarinus]|uniref:Uncharacterized protein n=1 Tax=Algibacter aquimarinus TaxID=1136748 RepID=A0ABP9HQV0_9FLAO